MSLALGRATRNALAAALLASLLAVPAGAFEVMNKSGQPAGYKVIDNPVKPGLVCAFEDQALNQDEELDRIRIRKIRVRGAKAFKTWVGYRFRVLQRPYPSSDYEVVFKSGIRKQKAGKNKPTYFSWRTWKAPETIAPSDFRVIVDVFWYRPGSKKRVRGKVRGVMEVHRFTHPTAPWITIGKIGDGGECYYNRWT